MERSHPCKQHHLECVNIPETVNNSMLLCLVLHFFEMFCTSKLLIKDDLVASKSLAIKKHCRVSSRVIKTHAYELNFDYLSYSKPANAFSWNPSLEIL